MKRKEKKEREKNGFKRGKGQREGKRKKLRGERKLYLHRTDSD